MVEGVIAYHAAEILMPSSLISNPGANARRAIGRLHAHVSRGHGTRMLILLLSLLLSACDRSNPAEDDTVRITIVGRAFTLELALDEEARVQGLSDREHIPEDGGMLFVFPRPQRLSFVMRRCLVPIDIIYLDATGRVVKTHAMKVEPYDTPDHRLTRYDSGYVAQFAVEVAGGTLETLGLKVGDKIDLPADSLKQRAR